MYKYRECEWPRGNGRNWEYWKAFRTPLTCSGGDINDTDYSTSVASWLLMMMMMMMMMIMVMMEWWLDRKRGGHNTHWLHVGLRQPHWLEQQICILLKQPSFCLCWLCSVLLHILHIPCMTDSLPVRVFYHWLLLSLYIFAISLQQLLAQWKNTPLKFINSVLHVVCPSVCPSVGLCL